MRAELAVSDSNPLKTELMDWTGCAWVESMPERMHGMPVVVQTRMDADGVLVNFDEGMSASEIAEEFGVEEVKVRGVLQFAGRLAERNAA
jgi:uncharacterized protein (DUF433 family)